MRRFIRTAIPAFLTAILLPSVTLASSDSAWDEMRSDIRAKCLAAAVDNVEAGRVVVDPFGSQSFGLALVSGKPKGAEGKVSLICVYDKQKKTVELGGELSEELMKSTE